MNSYIKRAIITGSYSDDNSRPVQTIKYFDRETEAEIIFPYGVHANLPEDSLMVVFPICNQDGNLMAIGGLPDKRIQVEQGEVVFFHPITKAKIHFKNDGTIEIDALEKDITINCNNANITAVGTLTIDAPNTEWTGNINLTGDITQNGNLVNNQTTSNGINLDGHAHSGSPTAPDGAVSNTGASL